MDYRESTCSATSANTLFFGGCHQHMRKRESIVSWHNVTSPTPVQTNGDLNGGGECDCTEGYSGGNGSGSKWSNVFNGGMETWQDSPTDLLTLQTFASGSTIDVGQCLQTGFKNVAAKRQWHGTYGFLSNDSCEQTRSIAADDTKYTVLGVGASLEYKLFSLTAHENDDGSWYMGSPLQTFQQNDGASGQRLVNATTGIITSTVSAQETKQQRLKCNEDSDYSLQVIRHVDAGSGNTFACEFNRNYLNGMTTDIDGDLSGAVFCDTDIPSLGYWIGQFNAFTAGIGDAYFEYTGSVRHGWSHGVGWSTNLPDGTLYRGDNYISVTVSRSNTGYTWALTADFTLYEDAPGDYTQYTMNYSGEIVLSQENYSSDMDDDNEGLLANWDLTDNKMYPWRTDNYVTFMPLVQRREVQGNVSPIGYSIYKQPDLRSPTTDVNGNAPWTLGVDPSPLPVPDGYTVNTENNDCYGIAYGAEFYSGPCDWIPSYETIAWFDPNSKYYTFTDTRYGSLLANDLISSDMDGAIIGKPHPKGAGGEGWFDFYYHDYHFCPQPSGEDCVGQSWELFTYAGGGTLADAVVSTSGIEDGGQMINFLPKCATHWVNNVQAHGLSRGALRTCGVTDSGIWAVKWAETRPAVPSQNFFRPCGADRVLIDETTACNVINGSMDAELAGLTGASVVLVSGDAIYTGCSQSDNGDGTWTLTTGTKVADLPSDYSRPIEGDVVGYIRFANAWPICGRQQVTVATGYSGSATGSVVTFLNAQTNLRTGDLLNLFNRTTGTVSSQSVSRVDDSHFFLSASFTGALTSSIYAMSAGAPDYHWDDDTQKWQYRYGFWNTSNRDASFSNSSSCATSCVSFTPCAEQVVCFSPNAENFANGNTSWFDDDFAADGIYGSYEQANVEFVMQDLLWQTPHYDPTAIILSVEDGTCPDNGFDGDSGKEIIYYKVPRVEALCSLPTSAPALPSGVTFPVMSQPPLAGVIGYSFNVTLQPTTYYANTLGHCEDGCRFQYYGCF